MAVDSVLLGSLGIHSAAARVDVLPRVTARMTSNAKESKGQKIVELKNSRGLFWVRTSSPGKPRPFVLDGFGLPKDGTGR